jgi:hypothetical protein
LSISLIPCLRNTDKVNADAPAYVCIHLMTEIIDAPHSPGNVRSSSCFQACRKKNKPWLRCVAAKNIHLCVSSPDAISFVILYIEGIQAILSRENFGACRGKE